MLNRIRWDTEFAQGAFEIGFLDHVQAREVRIPFDAMSFDSHDHFFFYYVDDQGEGHEVPFHRIKSVYKNGHRIWHREH